MRSFVLRPRVQYFRFSALFDKSQSQTLDVSCLRQNVRLASNSTKDPPIRHPWALRLLCAALGFVSTPLFFYRTSAGESKETLNPNTFTPFILESKDQVSSSSSIFTLRHAAPSPTSNPFFKPRAKDASCRPDSPWRPGQVWSVQLKQPYLNVARSYTPLPPVPHYPPLSTHLQNKDLPAHPYFPNDFRIRLLIRNHPLGELSTYLSRLPSGAAIDLRGPHPEFELPPNVDKIVFLAGGTGIAPALQIAHGLGTPRSVSTGVAGKPEMRILWANRERAECAGGVSDDVAVRSGRWLGMSWREWLGIRKGRAELHEEDSSTETERTSPLVRDLTGLQALHPGLTVSYFVDAENIFIDAASIRWHLDSCSRGSGKDFTQGRDDRAKGRKLILVSGPDGFVDYVAGPKVWSPNGKEVKIGASGGVLKKLGVDRSGWDVWRL